ncbi:hypothetical protein [Cohnella sp. WQ 127256]|uniref:hypothetical protein n=1 Tax=Cohnella sp. WQ 127256 TaxID=2938790 RepID=UPI00211734FF|nr:hypothetical protein [Cohnella sp. WQ 127256]
MTTQTIQLLMVPTFKINPNENCTASLDNCLEAAINGSKADLVELLYTFDQHSESNQNMVPDVPWTAELVMLDSWSPELHSRFFAIWDYNFDTMSDTINEVYNDFYPLI